MRVRVEYETALVWVTKYKQVKLGEYKVDFSLYEEEAFHFDDDDYMLILFEGWFPGKALLCE